jgi:hypothetical protein
MSIHDLKVKFLSNVDTIDSFVWTKLGEGDSRISFTTIDLYKKIIGTNVEEDIVETIRLANELYGTLETLHLEGIKRYPLLSKYLNELISHLENVFRNSNEYLSAYRVITDVDGNLILNNSRKGEKAKLKYNDGSIEDPDFYLASRYLLLEKYNKEIGVFLDNLKFLNDQIKTKIPDLNKIKTKIKEIPDLKEIFKTEEYFEYILQKTKDNFHSFDSTTGFYRWTSTDKNLALFACQLRDKHRLKDTFPIKNNQFLRKVFCKFFHSKSSEKTFQAERIKYRKKNVFSFITEFD